MNATRDDLDNVFAMDEAREKDGVGIGFGKLTVKIARAGGSNKEFAKVWQELTAPYKRIIENGIELPEDVAQDLVQTAYARAIVRDWNLVDMVDDGFEEDGSTPKKKAVPVKCDEPNVIAEFVRRPEFFRFVFEESRRIANYRAAVRELEAKN